MPIFDQGYQHWRGPLSGHGRRWLTIMLQGVRVQLTRIWLRRMLYLSLIPALVFIGFMSVWGLVEQRSEGALALIRNFLPSSLLMDPRAQRAMIWTIAFSYFFKIQMYFIMILVAVAGPGLISSDLRFNALPLYFSRPLNRVDYFVGKLGVIGALVGAVAVVPALLAYVLGLAFSLDFGVVKDTWQILLGSIGYGLLITISAGALMLAMSSLSRRSLYVGVSWAGLWIITGWVGTVLEITFREGLTHNIYHAEMSRWLAANPAPVGVQAPSPYERPSRRRLNFARVGPMRPNEEGTKWLENWLKAAKEADIKAREKESEALQSDWRPLFSYVSNLERISDSLLNTDAAWEKIGKAFAVAQGKTDDGDEPTDGRRFAEMMVPQYPWQWSGGVLGGLLGLSICILTLRVKSLDRLK
jgi:ABC-2 type transport system permease protein